MDSSRSTSATTYSNPRQLPRSPISPVSSRRVLVVVTVDAERYTPVDLTDVLDQGSVIRTRILNKLGIWDEEDQARALIFETEIGSLQIGYPLNDPSLAALCRARGDSKASLAFIVDRVLSPPLQTPPHSANPLSPSSPIDFPGQQRQRNISQPLNDQVSPTNPHWGTGYRSPPHRTTRPADITIETNGFGTNDEPQPRRVRPLPAIPTPTSGPSSGNPMGGDSYSRFHDINNDNHDLYDYNQRLQVSDTPPRPHEQATPVSFVGFRAAPIPFNWIRGELIGSNGSDSHVYMALDPVGGQIMAVKQKDIPRGSQVLSANQTKRSFLEAVKFECDLLRALDHKNVVKHLYFEETDTIVNIFMEYVPGGTLRRILQSFGPFPGNVTKFLTSQILDGLAYLHSHHILHRDLKAESILVQQDGLCKITDFSVSKVADQRGLVYTALQGSTFWMAPEVINTKLHGGGYTVKVDIWSLGCLVIEMWSNGRPWTGLDAYKVMKRLSDSLPPPLPTGLKLLPSAKDFYDSCFIVNPIARPAASELINHPYLILSDGWIFSLPPQKNFVVPDGFSALVETQTIPTTSVAEVPPRYTLHGFTRYSSMKFQPAEWLEKNCSDLLEYIDQSKYEPTAREECCGWAKSSLVFPRFVIFSYEAVYDLKELRTWVSAWNSWDDFTALIRYSEVKDRLCSLYDDMDQVDGLKATVALDIDALCARLYAVVTRKESYQRMANLRGEDAQAMLNLLQMLLDAETLDATFRSPFLNTMLKLSTRSGLHPSSLLQQQVVLSGAYAIASGQFGDVWRGTYQNETVAVKVLKFYAQSELETHLKKVLRETLIWRQLRYSNVLPFLCLHHVHGDERRVGLVSPWMSNGNLRDFLYRVPDADRVSLMADVAEGLEYLHNMQPHIVHGDLKAVNVLITDMHSACLADFGLSTTSKSQALVLSSFSSSPPGGTCRWTAPELLDGSEQCNTSRSDVYSFGCVCYEIFSGDIPFSDASLDSTVIYKVMQGQRPPRPTVCKPHGRRTSAIGLDDDIWDIVDRTWTSDPSKRPSMQNITKALPSRSRRQASQSRHTQKNTRTSTADHSWDLMTWATT